MRTPKETLQAWVDEFNNRDAKAAAALYDVNALSTQIAIGATLHGRAEVEANLADFFTHIPDSYTKVDILIAEGDWVAIEWSGGGTFFKTPESPGKTFTLRGCGFFFVQDGLIITQRGYWDKETWFSQLE